MTRAGAWLTFGRPRGGRLRGGGGQVWLTRSLCELWSKLAIKMVYLVIELLEVAEMAWVGQLIFLGLHAEGAYLRIHSDWSIVMLEGCSALHNLSLAALPSLCLLAIAGRRVDWGAPFARATSVVLVGSVHLARILAMLLSPDAYLYRQDSTGSVFVTLAASVASVGSMIV